MKTLFAILLQFSLFAICAGTQEPITVRGKLLTYDGQPVRNAYVSLMGQDTRFRKNTDSNGWFSFPVDKTGGYWLWLTGVHHKTLLIPLLVNESIEFEVQLATADYVSSFDSVFVIGDFNNFSIEEGAVLMKKKTDGTFAAVIKTSSDTLGYQLLGVQKENHPLSGTRADRYVFDSKQPLLGNVSGKYISIVDVLDGKARIIFDPDRLPRSDAEDTVVFKDSASLPARIVSIHEQIEQRKRLFFEALRAHASAGKDPNEFQYDWSKDRAALAKQIDEENNELVRQYLLLNYFDLDNLQEDSLMARSIFKEVPPTSAVWSLMWASPINVFHTITRIANQPEEAKAYVERVIEEHSDQTVRAEFLLYAIGQAQNAGDAILSSRYYAQLLKEFGDTGYAQWAKARYAPDRRIMKGKLVPDFEVKSLDDSSKTYTQEMLRGKIYLIDFWAVWCGPCVGEMENLHTAYEKYKAKGFTILSLSFDKKRQDVVNFRKKKWHMPWLNAFVDGGFQSEVAKTFEVAVIPKAILVGEDGRIICTGGELRGERLDETLAKVFGE